MKHKITMICLALLLFLVALGIMLYIEPCFFWYLGIHLSIDRQKTRVAPLTLRHSA